MIIDIVMEIDTVAYGQFEFHMQLATRCVPSISANGADNGLLEAQQRKKKMDVRRNAGYL